ncbi:MAG: hypothetical protein M3Y73_09625 [Actinomycetota bacterium]|nr:hypothetical protein [Actinomycetota bacterium]
MTGHSSATTPSPPRRRGASGGQRQAGTNLVNARKDFVQRWKRISQLIDEMVREGAPDNAGRSLHGDVGCLDRS